MALSATINSMNNGGATAPKAAPAPAAPMTASAAAAKGKSKNEAFRASGQALRAQLSEQDKALEGSKSDKVEFLNALGDISKPQKRRAGNEDLPSYQVIGFAFKLLEDMQIPVCPYKADRKSIIDVEYPPQWENHKAGEVVNLNSMEMALFISQPQFAGCFSGNGKTVKLSSKFSADRDEPLPILTTDTGSVKENLILVADKIEENGVTRFKVKDGYEKFAPLYVRRSSGGRTASAAQKNDTCKDMAAAFRAYFNSKK